MSIRTTPELIAVASGSACAGPHSCFYCGSPADESRPLELSGAFNEWWNVAVPDSRWICAGCAIALDEKVHVPGRDKPQKRRNWSWLVTSDRLQMLGAVAEVRAVLLAPPAPPWSIAIAVSGQKHLLFRTPVNHGGDLLAVQLELQSIYFYAADFTERLQLATRIAAVGGKPSLTESLDAGLAMRLLDGCSEQDINDWFSLAQEPLSALCAHICPSKAECTDAISVT